MVRLKTKWNKDKGPRSFGDTASSLCAGIWGIAGECVLNLENEGFETSTNAQRLDMIAEFAIFAIHVLDRFAHREMDAGDRGGLITAVVERFAEIVGDNRTDVEGPGDYRKDFIELFNRRSDEYAGYSCDEDGKPGFSMRRVLGERVRDLMGEKHRQWIPDYVIDKEAPQLCESLRRASRLVFG